MLTVGILRSRILNMLNKLRSRIVFQLNRVKLNLYSQECTIKSSVFVRDNNRNNQGNHSRNWTQTTNTNPCNHQHFRTQFPSHQYKTARNTVTTNSKDQDT